MELANSNQMFLKIKDKTINFNIVPLKFSGKNITSVYFNNNNKTLLETFEHKNYSRLKFLLADIYQIHLDKKIGDFLKILYSSKDSNYLCFLNKYGDNKFCEFKIDNNLKDKGIYCFIKDDKIKYIGRCTDNFMKRINYGYGKIQPKNCFKDGQATNCHLNSIINNTPDVKLGIHVMNDKSKNEIKELEKLILTCNRFEWNIQNS